jgi:hypothetical protein
MARSPPVTFDENDEADNATSDLDDTGLLPAAGAVMQRVVHPRRHLKRPQALGDPGPQKRR